MTVCDIVLWSTLLQTFLFGSGTGILVSLGVLWFIWRDSADKGEPK